jgi:uncharacterized protein (TIGR03435 family)
MRAITLALALPILALSQNTPPPAFDVASIRPSQSSEGRGGEGRGGGGPRGLAFLAPPIRVSPDGVTMRNAPLKGIIAWAYGVKEFQVSGPDWLATQRFDIAAKASAKASEDNLRVMAETLLADRFKVAVHRTTKETQAYVLVQGKGGAKLVESTSEGESDIQPDPAKMQITISRTPLSQLTDLLYMMLRTPVVDETGLTGKYDLKINIAKYASMDNGGGPVDPLGIIMTALQEEMGLKLESRKVTLDMVIVDHAEKTASEN